MGAIPASLMCMPLWSLSHLYYYAPFAKQQQSPAEPWPCLLPVLSWLHLQPFQGNTFCDLWVVLAAGVWDRRSGDRTAWDTLRRYVTITTEKTPDICFEIPLLPYLRNLPRAPQSTYVRRAFKVGIILVCTNMRRNIMCKVCQLSVSLGVELGEGFPLFLYV